MKKSDGTVRQRSMLGNPAEKATRQYFAPTRGIVEVVSHPDESSAGETVAQVWLTYYQSRLYSVPFLTTRMSKTKGGEWHGEDITPEEGNMVLVEFMDGNMADPVITACFNSPNNPIQARAAEAPHARRQMNGTTETIGKDGTRTIHVAKDDVLNIVGDGTVVVGGRLTITAAEILLDGYTKTTNHIEVASGASGAFTDKAGKMITVKNGIIVGIN